MVTDDRNKFATWFQRVTWIGIAVNLVLAIPTLLVPEQMMELASLPTATPLMWVRFSALLLILLSLFFIPEAVLLNRASRLEPAIYEGDGTAPVNILSTRHGRRWTIAGLAIVALIAIAGVFAYVQFLRELPAPYFASDEDHFLFGSTG